jgi:hypothetical protein
MRIAGYEPSQWSEAFAVQTSNVDIAIQRMLEGGQVCTDFADPRLVDIGVAVSGRTYIVTMGTEARR